MKKNKITIINYGMGNIGSIKNMINYLGHEATISNKKQDINDSDFLILPGVGKFDHAMKNIFELNLIDVVRENALERKIPILGICLGMQLMCLESEEGKKEGLSLIDYKVKKFNFSDQTDLKIPHMGWNFLNENPNNLLFKNISGKLRFYFVHSYYVEDIGLSYKSSTTSYGLDFVSSFEKNNLFGVQFHPEKSHRFGKELFKNFLNFYE